MFEEMSERFYNLFVNFWPKVPGVILSFVIGYLVIQILLAILRRGFRVIKLNKAMSGLLLSLSAILMWAFFAAEITRQVGLSGLSIAISGSLVAIGFALANGGSALTSDILSGLSLARDKDFEVGYKIKSGDIEGTIEKVDIRKVRIKDNKGIIHIVPNSQIDNIKGWSVIDKDPK